VARDWIPWVVGFERKPEVLNMAAELGFSNWEMAARCMAFFAWVGNDAVDLNVEHPAWKQATDNGQLGENNDPANHCVATGINLETIDSAILTDGLGQTLAYTAGWIVLTDHGVILLNWNNINSKSAKKRLLAAKRQERFNAEKYDNALLTLEREKTNAAALGKRHQRTEQQSREEILCADSGGSARTNYGADAAAAANAAGSNGNADSRAVARLLASGVTWAEFETMPPPFRVSSILSAAQCDESFRGVVGALTKSDPSVAVPVWDTFVRLCRRKRKPANPGGWFRTELRKRGLEV
jgi:hypothetical protein